MPSKLFKNISCSNVNRRYVQLGRKSPLLSKSDPTFLHYNAIDDFGMPTRELHDTRQRDLGCTSSMRSRISSCRRIQKSEPELTTRLNSRTDEMQQGLSARHISQTSRNRNNATASNLYEERCWRVDLICGYSLAIRVYFEDIPYCDLWVG